MLGPKYRKKFSVINAGIVAEIIERYLSDPDSIDESEYQLLLSTFEFESTSSLVQNNSTEIDKKSNAYLHADINPLVKNDNSKYDFEEQNLNSIYLGSIGWEFSHLRNSNEKEWLYDAAENKDISLDNEAKLNLLKRLIHVENFEQFLHKSFVGARWYGLEGSEALIIIIDEIINGFGSYDSINFGMPHRGRLNVLAHIFDKPYSEIFSEFKEENINHMSSGNVDEYLRDVKYHLGAKKSTKSELLLIPNPSHLEMINPVILGVTKAYQKKGKTSLGVLMHGDAAFPGEGINSESFNLSKLDGYDSGGSIHIVTNNQLGFTTNPKDSYPLLHSTDFVRGFDIPVIHVNGDDIHACIKAISVAIDYKKKFNKDVVLDLIAYRRFGHQEMDDPNITQPELYKKIKSHPTVTEIYSKKLLDEGIIETNEILNIKNSHTDALTKENEIKFEKETSIWPGEFTTENIDYQDKTNNITSKELISMNKKLYKINDSFHINSRIKQIIDKRLDMDENFKIEWGHAELLAICSILDSKISVRFSGQDSRRGTFSQRNAYLWDSENSSEINLLEKFSNQSYVDVINSPLSEMAALAFEFGYSISENKSLVIWEAQFGDFVNNAQSVIDEFISSSQPKWGLDSNMVLLLPHGYEGMGANHSSGWMERFLDSAADNNIAVANCTNSSQYFHLLRNHALLDKQANPLIIFTPKSLLRHPHSSSKLKQLASSNFNRILKHRKIKDPTKIIFGSGKIIVDILNADNINNLDPKTDIISLEQLYPFPTKEIVSILKSKNLKEITWVQEEPRNRGAWKYFNENIIEIPDNMLRPKYVGRKQSATTATGSSSVHKIQQKRIIDSILK
ncbi:MAG: 2-oxoglutarate dehydrogenase E1 component [Dehalococcoidia bacterium]